MQRRDINDAVRYRRNSDLEEAFKALVHYPDYDAIDDANADTLKTMLEEVCEALEGNNRIVPNDVVDLIEGETDEKCKPTYAACAARILEYKHKWFEQFEEHAED